MSENKLIYKSGNPSLIIQDILKADFPAIFALCDWLRDQEHDPIRGQQDALYRRAIGRLETNLEIGSNHPGNAWIDFVLEVRSIFILDLRDSQDILQLFKSKLT